MIFLNYFIRDILTNSCKAYYYMCYDIAYLTRKIKVYEKRFNASYGDKPFIPMYHTNGFDHMEVPVITGQDPEQIKLFVWGLIPAWAKDRTQVVKIQNSTLNARDNTLFEKPSYKAAARGRRCLVVVDGFYDHHWKNGKSYPYFIKLKSGEPFAMGGIWERWERDDMIRYSVSIITTDPNPLMAHIHNRPKASENPRMPFMVRPELESTWIKEGLDPKEILDLIGPYPEEALEAYTVPRLRGKAYKGNVKETVEHCHYEELVSSQGSLF